MNSPQMTLQLILSFEAIITAVLASKMVTWVSDWVFTVVSLDMAYEVLPLLELFGAVLFKAGILRNTSSIANAMSFMTADWLKVAVWTRYKQKAACASTHLSKPGFFDRPSISQ